MTAASAVFSPAVFAAFWNSLFIFTFCVFTQPSFMAFSICKASGAPSSFPWFTVSILTSCGMIMVWYRALRICNAFAFAR